MVDVGVHLLAMRLAPQARRGGHFLCARVSANNDLPIR
jgi:hypothetical protein